MTDSIETKTSRAKLAPRREPYWSRVRAGLFVGFRQLAEGEGTWIARRRADDGKQQYRALGTLASFDDAKKIAESWGGNVESGATHKAVTVEAACRAYAEHLKTHKSKTAAADAKGRFKRLVFDTAMGRTNLDKLNTATVKTWLNDQLVDDGDEDDLRRSKDTANRNLTSFKAAMNFALKDRLVATDSAWKTVLRFPKAGRRRERFLDADDRARLLEQCDPHLSALVRALLLTAARPGEIAKATVRNLDKKQRTMVLNGKTGPRVVTLSTAAATHLTEQAKGKLPSAPLLADAYGHAWNKDSWKKLFKTAVTTAKLPDDVVLYTLRHTGISEMIAGGVDTFVVAALAGTSTAMIDQHYGHLRHDQTRARLDAVAMV